MFVRMFHKDWDDIRMHQCLFSRYGAIKLEFLRTRSLPHEKVRFYPKQVQEEQVDKPGCDIIASSCLARFNDVVAR